MRLHCYLSWRLALSAQAAGPPSIGPSAPSVGREEMTERIMSQKNETSATKGVRRCSGTTENVRHCAGVQIAQYFHSSSPRASERYLSTAAATRGSRGGHARRSHGVGDVPLQPVGKRLLEDGGLE